MSSLDIVKLNGCVAKTKVCCKNNLRTEDPPRSPAGYAATPKI